MPPTMLASEELQLLHWLAAKHYTGEGLIVDGGAFLGGSTTALAAGVVANPAAADKGRVIHSYDLFDTLGEPIRPSFAQFGLTRNESFRELYERNIAPYRDRVEVHEGDLLKELWTFGKIEILFLDCCKASELHDHAVRIWFPRLIPGKSVVLQQDFGWFSYAWGNIMMEVFRDHFVVLDDVPVATRAYLCVKPISEEQASRCTYASLSGDERIRYMEEALQTVTREDFRVRMLVGFAQLAQWLSRSDLIPQILSSVFAAPRADLAVSICANEFPNEMLMKPAIESLVSRVRRLEEHGQQLEARLAECLRTQEAMSAKLEKVIADQQRAFMRKLRRSIRKRLGKPPE